MGGGQVVHIERLAAGGFLALEITAIPGGCSYLVGLGPGTLRHCLLLRGLFRKRFWATSVVCGPRVLRPLCRSQAGEQSKNRQSLSYTTWHSVYLAYSK